MSELKRWAENGSEVDAVLRSVVRYGQQQGPGPAELQRLLRVAAPTAAPRLRPRPARAFFVSVASGLAAALGGLAWASYVVSRPASPSEPEREVPTSARPASGSAKSRPLPQTSPAPSQSLTPPEVGAPPRLAPASAALAPSTRALGDQRAVSAERDAALLQQARLAVALEPQRALSLIRDHEVHFPSSALGEERSALQIEALSRLGRADEAERRFAKFEAQFPRSPYRRRLRALLGASP